MLLICRDRTQNVVRPLIKISVISLLVVTLHALLKIAIEYRTLFTTKLSKVFEHSFNLHGYLFER